MKNLQNIMKNQNDPYLSSYNMLYILKNIIENRLKRKNKLQYLIEQLDELFGN